MIIIDINNLKPPDGEAAQFQGFEHEAKVSFFVVQGPHGTGPDRHRHPYEETFVVLEGEIEFIVAGETHMLGGGNIAVAPANTWHEFKNRSDKQSLMVNIHPVEKMITEWA